MDTLTMLRQQALQLANQRAKASDTTEEVIAEADKILKWLKADMPADTGSPATPPSEPAQHESAAAVEGQEPKGE